MARSLSICTLRSWTDETGEITVLPMRTGLTGIWCWRRWDKHQGIYVLLGLSCSQLALIHDDTLSMQAEILPYKLTVLRGQQNLQIWLSSAYACGCNWWRISCSTSAGYRRKRISPGTDPCGTPQSTNPLWHSTLNQRWNRCVCRRADALSAAAQVWTEPVANNLLRPQDFCSRRSNVSWSPRVGSGA